MNVAPQSAQVKHTGKNGLCVTYAEMVKNLFKPMEGVGAMMMHAAIGIAGESGELRTAYTRKNVLEECGDTEFYIEAAWQTIPASFRGDYGIENSASDIQFEFGILVDRMHQYSSELLDHAKKVWVYGGSKGDRNDKIAAQLMHLELTLKAMYGHIGSSREEAMQLNMIKLLGSPDVVGRYETGAYSDEQALQRADKVSAPDLPGGGPATRKFMSDSK